MRESKVQSVYQSGRVGRQWQKRGEVHRSRSIALHRIRVLIEEGGHHVFAQNCRTGRIDLELGPQQSTGSRHYPGRRVVVKYAPRVEDIFSHRRENVAVVVGRRILSAQRTDESGEHESRLLEMSIRRLIAASVVVCARLGIQQDRGNQGLHVSSALPKCARHPLHISRTRIALHHTLDELLRNEWGHVRMRKQVVQCPLQIGLRREVSRRLISVQQILGTEVVQRSHRDHRNSGIHHGRRDKGSPDRNASRRGRSVRPARKHPRQFGHIGLHVAGDRGAVGIDLNRAVGIQLVRADREQLHHFPCVVLVGDRSRAGVGDGVICHVEVGSHSRTHSNVVHDLRIAGKSVVEQHLLIRNHQIVEAEVHERGRKNLTQNEAHALP